MTRLRLSFALVVLACVAVTLPSPAQARGGRFIFGFGCCGFYPYTPYYYPPYPVYEAPPPSVVYVTPPQPSVPYVVPSAPAPLSASATSPVFTDAQGRSCRHFETAIDGSPVAGTACLQADGTWRTVGE